MHGLRLVTPSQASVVLRGGVSLWVVRNRLQRYSHSGKESVGLICWSQYGYSVTVVERVRLGHMNLSRLGLYIIEQIFYVREGYRDGRGRGHFG